MFLTTSLFFSLYAVWPLLFQSCDTIFLVGKYNLYGIACDITVIIPTFVLSVLFFLENEKYFMQIFQLKNYIGSILFACQV